MSKGDDDDCDPVPLGQETHSEHSAWLAALENSDPERWRRIRDLPTVCRERWRQMEKR
jgi:hypothetical protein